MFIDGVALALGILFLILFFLGLSQLIQVLRSHDSNISLRNLIVLLLTSSAILRSIFWFKSAFPLGGVSNQVLMIIYFLPVWFDFSGLSGLAVFYANIINSSGPYRNYPSIISFIGNFIFLSIDLAIGSMLDDPNTDTAIKTAISNFYQVFSIFLDFLLASLLLYFGCKFRQVGAEKISYMLPRSFKTFLNVNWLVVCCYIARGLCNCFFYANAVLPASMRFVYFSKIHPLTPFSVLLFFLLIEIIPNSCVILLLWKVSENNSRYSIPYAYENIKNDLFSSTDSRDYLLSSERSPMLSSDKESDSMEPVVSVGIGDTFAESNSIYSFGTVSRLSSYSAPSHSNRSSSSSSGGSLNNKMFNRDSNEKEFYPKIASNNNTPNTSGHALSPLRLNQQQSNSGIDNNNGNDNRNCSNDSNDNNSSPPSTIKLNFSSSSLSAQEHGSPGGKNLVKNLVGPGVSPGSESNNSSIWRQIQTNLQGRQDSRASMSAGSDDMLSNLEGSGLLGDSIMGSALANSILYNSSDDTPGTPPNVAHINANSSSSAGGAVGTNDGSQNNGNDPSSSAANLNMTLPKSSDKGKSQTSRKPKEKYSNTVSPRDILLMSIKEDS